MIPQAAFAADCAEEAAAVAEAEVLVAEHEHNVQEAVAALFDAGVVREDALNTYLESTADYLDAVETNDNLQTASEHAQEMALQAALAAAITCAAVPPACANASAAATYFAGIAAAAEMAHGVHTSLVLEPARSVLAASESALTSAEAGYELAAQEAESALVTLADAETVLSDAQDALAYCLSYS